MNVGLAEARNDLVVRVDAHTLVRPDYVARSLDALERLGRRLGRRPHGARGRERLRSSRGRGDLVAVRGRARTVPLRRPRPPTWRPSTSGTFDRRIVLEVGGYDETDLQWAAEDQELNFRLRRAGRRIRLDPAIRSWYFPAGHRQALWRQYAQLRHVQGVHAAQAPDAALLATAGAGGDGREYRDLDAGLRWPGAAWLVRAAPVRRLRRRRGAVALQLGDQPGVAPHRALRRARDLPLGLRPGVLAGAWVGSSPVARSTADRRGPPVSPVPSRARMREYAVKGVHAGLREVGRRPSSSRALRRSPGGLPVRARRSPAWSRSSPRDPGPRTSSGKR